MTETFEISLTAKFCKEREVIVLEVIVISDFKKMQ